MAASMRNAIPFQAVVVRDSYRRKISVSSSRWLEQQKTMILKEEFNGIESDVQLSG
jgi:hypothetical protein